MNNEIPSYALGNAAPKHRDDPAGLGMHTDNLHDENEGAGGRRLDEATGEPIDNSTYTGLEELAIVNEQDVQRLLGDKGVKSAIGDDPAEAWLEENDPDYKE